MLERWFSFPPTITYLEIAVVASAAMFLLITPGIMAFLEARRRRAEMARLAPALPATAMDFQTMPAYSGAAEMPPAAGSVVDPAWPMQAPPPVPSVWDDSESPPRPSTAPPALPEWNHAYPVPSDIALENPADAASQAGFAAPTYPDEAAANRAAQASEPTQSPAAPDASAALVEAPQIAAQQPATAPVLSDEVPVLRVSAFPEPPAQAAWKCNCQLIELRQARLPQWPPDAVRNDAQREQLWEQAERLAGRFDRALSTTNLTVPTVMQATTLGGVETDGHLVRLHFLLFDDLWPTDPRQAQAEAVFEIDPLSGPLRSWVQPR